MAGIESAKWSSTGRAHPLWRACEVAHGHGDRIGDVLGNDVDVIPQLRGEGHSATPDVPQSRRFEDML